MNDGEVDDLIQQHYKDEAQTLTKGTEGNLLKFKELTGTLSPAEAQRWNDIKRTFKKNLLLRTGDGQDPVGLVVGQLSAFNEGLESIKQVIAASGARPQPAPVTVILVPSAKIPAPSEGAAKPDAGAAGAPAPVPSSLPEEGVREVSITPETLKKIWDLVEHQNQAKEKDPDKDKPGKS